MRRPILAVTHGVMGENENGRKLHQCGEPNGRPRIVAEDDEGRRISPQLRERQTIDDRRHGVLAHSEMEIPASRTIGLEVARAWEFERGLVRGPEVGRAAHDPWYV